MPDLHALVVHFTIALLAVSVTSDFLFLISGKEKFRRISRSLLIPGTLAALAAVVSGMLARNALEIPQGLENNIARHQWSGIMTLIAFVLLCLFRYGLAVSIRESKPFRWVYYTVSVLGLIFLFRTGFLGGELVLKFGIGADANNRKLPLVKPSFENEE